MAWLHRGWTIAVSALVTADSDQPPPATPGLNDQAILVIDPEMHTDWTEENNGKWDRRRAYLCLWASGRKARGAQRS
jgi:hypothetical protein